MEILGFLMGIIGYVIAGIYVWHKLDPINNKVSEVTKHVSEHANWAMLKPQLKRFFARSNLMNRLKVIGFGTLIAVTLIMFFSLVGAMFDTNDLGTDIVMLALCIIAFIIYLIPSWIAVKRNHTNKVALIIANVLLGWSGVVWVGCLIWAVWKSGDNAGNITIINATDVNNQLQK